MLRPVSGSVNSASAARTAASLTDWALSRCSLEAGVGGDSRRRSPHLIAFQLNRSATWSHLLPFPRVFRAHGRLAQIRSVRLCCGGGTWARWRQANWASGPTLPRRAQEMDRPRLAHQPLVAGQRAVGHHGQPCRGELAMLPHEVQQPGDVLRQFHDHERGGLSASSLQQSARVRVSQTRTPASASSRRSATAQRPVRSQTISRAGSGLVCVARAPYSTSFSALRPQSVGQAVPDTAWQSGTAWTYHLIHLFQPQLHHAAVEPRAGHAEQSGRPGLVALRPRQRPADQLALDAAEILVQARWFPRRGADGRPLGRPGGAARAGRPRRFRGPRRRWCASATTWANSSRLPGQA